MKIKLNEINDMFNNLGVNVSHQEGFIAFIEELDDYMLIVEEDVMEDIKHLVCQYMRDAISCGFDVEIMVRDYDVPEEIAEIIAKVKHTEMEINL